MAIELEQVRHLARLARLDLPEQALDKLTDDVGRILDHVRNLEELDVEGVLATSHGVDLATSWRDDEPAEVDGEPLLAGAPARMGDAVSVPRIIE